MGETLTPDQVARLDEARRTIMAKRAEILKLQAKLSVELSDLDDLEAGYLRMVDEVPEGLRRPHLLGGDEPGDAGAS